MDPANWQFSDIAEHACPGCGTMIEFWKDDVKRGCPRCGRIVFNPTIGDTCLSWCDKAGECIGNQDIDEWKRRHGRGKEGTTRDPG
jgi:predicted  nucleic acid-binding Zn-ribbon protein